MTDHELALLACMQSNPRLAAEVAQQLQPEDFTRHDHRVIFATMQDMLAQGERVDHVTLPATITAELGDDDAAALAARLPSVAAEIADLSHGSDYARLVLEESIRRMLIRGAGVVGTGEVAGQVDALERLVYDARSRMLGDTATHTYDSASILRPLDALLSASEEKAGLPYPLPGLKRQYGSYEKGRYTIIGGYSGDGKTTFAMQWVEDLCEAGARVGVYELEMTGLGLGRLLMLQGGGLSSRQLKRAEAMDAEASARYEARRKQIAGWDLSVRTGAITPQQIRQDQVSSRFDVIVVDHIQKFERTSAGEYADLVRYSSQLHRISRDLDASVIALAQLNKRQQDSGEPDVSRLRGGTAMEEDADDVLMVYAERFANGMRYQDRRSKLLVGKMRDGEADLAIPMVLDQRRIRFVETAVDGTRFRDASFEQAGFV